MEVGRKGMCGIANENCARFGRHPRGQRISVDELPVDHFVGRCQLDHLVDDKIPAFQNAARIFMISRLGPPFVYIPVIFFSADARKWMSRPSQPVCVSP